VVCLLEPAQLDKYYVSGGLGLPGGGLIEYYELQGLIVRRKGMTDYQRPTENELQEVLQYFDQLPAPVLLHCSAGIDRTTPTAAFIVERRGGVKSAG